MIPYLIALFICALALFIISIVNAVKDYTVYKSNRHKNEDEDSEWKFLNPKTIYSNQILNATIYALQVPCIVIGNAYHIEFDESYNCTFVCESIWMVDEDFYPSGIQLKVIIIKDNETGLTFGDRTSLFVHKNTNVRPIELSDDDRRLLKLIKD